MTTTDPTHTTATNQIHSIGIRLIDELDCSDKLVAKAIEIYENNRLRYLGPDECTKREMELVGAKKNPAWSLDPTGFVKHTLNSDDPKARTDSQHLLSYAW